MSRVYSLEFRQKMVSQLMGAGGVSARTLSARTGVSQCALSRWLRDARSLSGMEKTPPARAFSVKDRIRILHAAEELEGEALLKYLEEEGPSLADLEEWRIGLADSGAAAAATTRRIRALERDLARKEKALAEAAALLVLQKKAQALFAVDEDDEPDDPTER
jgi:transposase